MLTTLVRRFAGGNIWQIVFRAAAIAYGASAVGFILWRMFEYRLPFPFWDGLLVDEFIGQHFLPDWTFSIGLHFHQNEHVPLFPLLMWTIDHRWFASEGIIVIALNAVLMLVMVALVMSWMRGDGPIGFSRVALMTATPVIIFWPAQSENLNWPVQLNEILSWTAMLAAIPALLTAQRKSREPRRYVAALLWLAVSVACLFVSSFSLTSGLLGWPILLMYLACHRTKWWFSAAFAATGFGTVAFYLYLAVALAGYGNPIATLSSFGAFAEYLFALLGVPLFWLIESPLWHVSVGLRMGAGILVLALTIWAGLQVFCGRMRDDVSSARGDSALALLAILGSATVLGIALTRFGLGVEQTLSPRYNLVAALAWLGAAGYWIPRVHAPRWIGRLGWLVTLLLAFVMVASYAQRAAALRESAARVRVAAMAAILGFDHPQLWPRLISAGRNLDPTIESLRRRGHPLFDEPWREWYGRNAIAVLGQPIKDRCLGSVDRFARLGGTVVSLGGWVWDSRRKQPPPLLVIVGTDGVVRGVGATGFIRFDLVEHFRRIRMYHAGWYASGSTRTASVRVYSVTDDGQLCDFWPHLVPKP